MFTKMHERRELGGTNRSLATGGEASGSLRASIDNGLTGLHACHCTGMTGLHHLEELAWGETGLHRFSRISGLLPHSTKSRDFHIPFVLG